jgi:hypothetical protein
VIELDHETGTARVDWHGYAPDEAELWSDRIIEAAYQHGFRYVEFVHGAADVAARGSPGYRAGFKGRGQIKEVLRRRLYGNAWRRWVADRREGRHRVHEGRMVIALRDNPNPDGKARWPIVPPRAY